MIIEQSESNRFFLSVASLGPAYFLGKLIPQDVLKTDYGFYNEKNAREFFLLKLLSDVQKTGLTMIRWYESDISKYEKSTPPYTMLLDALIDEQCVHQRKLFEGLCLIINFSHCNDPIYYYHYCLLNELNIIKSKISEHKDFFGVTSEIYTEAKKNLLTKIQFVENALPDLTKCFYLKKNNTKELNSQRQMMLKALKLATEDEKSGLNFTYEILYGHTSKRIHFSVLENNDNIDHNLSLNAGFCQCGLSAMWIIRRAHLITGLKGEDINEAIMRIKPDKKNPFNLVTKNFEKGDFVASTTGFLGQIIEIKESDFGYKSYLVKYIADQPSAGIQQNWYSSLEISLLLKEKQMSINVKEFMKKFCEENNLDFSKITDQEISENITKAIAYMYQKKSFKSFWNYDFKSRIHEILQNKI